MNEKTGNGTSGQCGQKLRQDSERARPSQRLREKPGRPPPEEPSGPSPKKKRFQRGAEPESPGEPSGGESAGEGAGAPPSGPDKEAARLDKSQRRMEQRGAKLDRARGKLAAQKPPKRPGPVKRVGRAAGRGVHGYVHGKLFQVEQENVGTEGAHRSELAGEAVARGGARLVKKAVRTHPARAARRAESSYIKAQADYHTRKLAQEHPEAMKNALSRQWHRHKLKKQYQKQAREAAKQGAKAAGKTTAATGRAVAGFVKRHPVGALILAACFLLLLIMQSCMSQMVSLGNATVGAVAASTYPAEDADLLGAEAAYVAMEGELQDYLDSYESTHSYDEYHFDLDEIEHDPYNLLSILCALHEGAWTVDEVRGTLQMLFDRQYILTENVVVETRYYTDTRTDSEGNEYDVEVPYDYYICYVTLSNENLSKLPIYIMGEEALSRYALFIATLGNRPDLFPGSGYVGKYITNPPRNTRCRRNIWPTSGLRPFWPRRRNTSAIPMCGAATLPAHPLTVRASCRGSSITAAGTWAAWGPPAYITSALAPAHPGPAIWCSSWAPTRQPAFPIVASMWATGSCSIVATPSNIPT